MLRNMSTMTCQPMRISSQQLVVSQQACGTVQVVETAIMPQRAPAERVPGAEMGPLHHREPLHTPR